MKIRLFVFLILASVIGCRERYDIPYTQPPAGFLVVEGIINAAGVTEVRLSRTTPVGQRALLTEKGAAVEIQGDNNQRFSLNEVDSGVYRSAFLNLAGDAQYRLWISAGGKEYASAYSSALPSPELDSLSWKRQNGGVEIFVNAHGDAGQTRYYKWDYAETWEFSSPYESYFKIVITTEPDGSITAKLEQYNAIGKYNDTMITCWKSQASTSIITANSTKLNENRIYAPVRLIPENAWELSKLYSINVKQYGLSEAAFQFYEKMKKNTESLGSIFDAQPTELKGNIRCISDDAELVVGYVEVTSSREKRIFISKEEVPGWNYQRFCAPLDTVPPVSESLLTRVLYAGKIPLKEVGQPGSWILAAQSDCVDCRLRGSSNKPLFWP